MNKVAIFGIGVVIILSAFFSWQYVKKPAKVTEHITGNYLGSDYKGNYIWGGAMNLAWNELAENIIQDDIELLTQDQVALEMVSKLNNAPFSTSDLDAESYYIKSGYGQETVDEINRESKLKFPSKSFEDLDMNLNPTDIISYAYLLKEVAYKSPFKKDDVLFQGQTVQGFIADNETQRENVKIIKYDNDDKFIITLQLTDQSDQLILAKGYDMHNPQAIVDEINQHMLDDPLSIGKSDTFKAPKLQVDHYRNYGELIGKSIANPGFTGYAITQMFENIKFDMDEKGARVENEGVIGLITAIPGQKPQSKNFILDKPYWVIMKKADSQHPYFILGVNNTEVMEEK